MQRAAGQSIIFKVRCSSFERDSEGNKAARMASNGTGGNYSDNEMRNELQELQMQSNLITDEVRHSPQACAGFRNVV